MSPLVPVLRRPMMVGGTAALLVGLIAGCSSSKGGSGGGSHSASSQASAAGSSAATPTGSPIKIGVIATTSGSQATGCNQGATVAPAWADWINKEQGGINGHPVQVTVKNDGGDPATAQSVAKELVSAGVTVVLVSCDNLLPAFEGTFLAAKIPLVSGPANNPDWYTKAGLYPLPTDLISGQGDQVAVAKKFAHATKVADLYCSEVAACAQAAPLKAAAAKKLGLGFTSLAVSSTATSYTAQCLQLQQEKVDYAILSFVAPAGAKFIQDCQAQGYTPTFGTSSQSLGAKDLFDVQGAKLFGVAYGFPSVADAAVVQTFRDVMGKYAENGPWREGVGSMSWVGLEAIRKAASTVSTSASVSAADITKRLDSFKDEDLGGLLANKVTFTAGKPLGLGKQPCYFALGVQDGKLIAPNGLTPICPGS
jgi:branched-chain amino acid transport system substrate-binding protein